MDQRLHGVVVQGASNSSELTEPVEARRTDTGNTVIQTQVRRKGDTEDVNVVTYPQLHLNILTHITEQSNTSEYRHIHMSVNITIY